VNDKAGVYGSRNAVHGHIHRVGVATRVTAGLENLYVVLWMQQMGRVQTGNAAANDGYTQTLPPILTIRTILNLTCAPHYSSPAFSHQAGQRISRQTGFLLLLWLHLKLTCGRNPSRKRGVQFR
jgi:hypothetical protein